MGYREKNYFENFLQPPSRSFVVDSQRMWSKNVGYSIPKEYVAVLIGLYKKNGAVSCVGFDFVLYQALYTTNPRLVVIRFARNKKQYLSLTYPRKDIIL